MKTLQEAVNEAAEKLPEDWMIGIIVERGAGWVDLTDDKGNPLAIDACAPLAEQVTEALNLALNRSNETPRGESPDGI